jgi:hypothetical protein
VSTSFCYGALFGLPDNAAMQPLELFITEVQHAVSN